MEIELIETVFTMKLRHLVCLEDISCVSEIPRTSEAIERHIIICLKNGHKFRVDREEYEKIKTAKSTIHS